MYSVALGMAWLHSRHMGFKAANVLVTEVPNGSHACSVADFPCSIGVAGTGFWRASEILQACKDTVVNQRQDLFTTSADVCSYGVTCYEILTGKLLFEHHHLERTAVC